MTRTKLPHSSKDGRSNPDDAQNKAAKIMEDNITEINTHVDATSFPAFIMDKIKALGINGL